MGAPAINETEIGRRLKKAKNSNDLRKELAKSLPNGVQNLIVSLNGKKIVSFTFQGRPYEIVV